MRRSETDAFFIFRIKASFLVERPTGEDAFTFFGRYAMKFAELYDRISTKLRWIARKHNYGIPFLDEDDLYQEMCMYLLDNYKDGLPEGINEPYVIKGCEFHIQNYIRVKKDKASLFSLEQPLDEEGLSFKDILEARDESLDRKVDRKMTVEIIQNNGFTPREKEVFSLLLEGYTTREAGARLGISHVRVTKLKHNLIKKWHKKWARRLPS